MKKKIKSISYGALLLSASLITYNCSEDESFYEENLQEFSVTESTSISSTSEILIEAENFDSMSGIKTETTSDTDGGINVGWIDEGDYLEYEIDVPASGSYKFDFRVASKTETSKFDFYQDDTKLSNVNKAASGGWQSWVTTSKTVELEEGSSILKLLATGGGWNINWISITPIDVASTTVENIALSGTAEQSSTNTSGVGAASLAIDGNTSGEWSDDSSDNSVTRTNIESEAWWQVRLGDDYEIGDIVIWNRTDCCTDRLTNFDVFVYNENGDQVYKSTITEEPSPSLILSTGGVVGSRVRIKLKGEDNLSLAEVQVYSGSIDGSELEEEIEDEEEEEEEEVAIGDLNSSWAPSENFDLSTWKITLSSGEEKTVEQINDGFELEDQFYTGSDGGMVFKNYPKGAGTTTNSTYSRVELREMLRGTNDDISTQGINGNNWVFSSSSSSNQSKAGGVDGVMEATLTVNRVTTTSESTSQLGRVIIGQIHASDNEPIRLYYHKQPGHSKGAIYFAHDPNDGDEVFENLLGDDYVEETGSGAGDYTGAGSPSDGIELGEVFSYKIEVVGNTMYVYIYNESGSTLASTTFDMNDSGLEDDYMYFKAGLYSANKTVTSSSDYEQVTFYRLETSHD
ncbi:polysaccharide lyase family 7 protein [Cellulophaga baltica]|uniref:polysaccharide lyase family 7 protein n=1 Tax=Cellulophaga TaxID=104264 RepID=UPI001C078A5D|nr:MULTISPECIES: polysaccharide lyase family 7 protein [Cellulophaga]MBU2994833.1 polysaccharide lyase family 7 protein [Cellulophaga baltica]MDO6766228.1 polysaccharide lyase family 7 protein [Cellulophaga sp. 1_MG-2023]